MRLCKYCNKPIAEKDIWNPDNDGNGYHHQCLVDMEFKVRDKQIYDKGKMEVLDKIRAEIMKLQTYKMFEGEDAVYVERDDVLKLLEQEQKPTGHWIDRDVYDADRWKCSECGRTEPYKENYCPNCGTKMVEEQESEE